MQDAVRSAAGTGGGELEQLRAELRRTQRELRSAQLQIERYKASVSGKDNMGRLLSEEKARRDLYLSNLLRVMPEIVLFLDEKLNVVMCSEAYLRAANMSGYDEIIGTPGIPDRLEYPDDQPREKVEAELYQTMWNMETLEEEIYFNFVKGVPKKYFKKYTLPIRNRNDEPAGVILLFHDMTDIIAARNQAQKASESKSSFLANMSHEIRTPMNAIIGMTNIAKGSDEIEQKDYCLGKIEVASNHLLGLINDILDMSKIEANKLTVSLEETNFERMLQKITNVISYNVDKKRQLFRVIIDPAIPQFLITDDQRLSQVITNLLSNAVKFTPEGGNVSLSARCISSEADAYTVRVDVSDTGIGISEEQQQRLFQSFEQADESTSRRFGGTGLGLAISKNIVEMLGGHIWVESREGEGSTFSFTFKAVKARENLRPAPEAGINWEGLRVLAVDDEEDVLYFFESVARRHGFTCDLAGGGAEALQLIEGSRDAAYDIIFVDKRMPDIDGLELTRQVKARRDHPVVIMISALEWSELEAEARAAGVNGFLPKPLFSASIADTIVEHCSDTGPGAAEGAEGSEYDFSASTLLLAEDIEINREILITLLEPTGIQIECAGNGREAMQMFEAHPERYDAILMDIQMPEMDGYEATRCIRAMGCPPAAAVPIIAMTANVFREDIEKCHAAGMNDHIGKPLDIEEVNQTLARYLLS